MTRFDTITIQSAMICEDVRREEGGNKIALGIMHGGMIPPGFPAVLSNVMIRLDAILEGGTMPFIRLTLVKKGTRKKPLITVDLEPPTSTVRSGYVELIVDLNPITFHEPGEYQFKMKANGKTKPIYQFEVGELERPAA